MAGKQFWNKDFTETVPGGAPGNQAYFGIFYRNARWRFERLTQAEGNEVSKNPETATVNLIGQMTAKDVVKSYREELTKEVVIEKGEPNYEFFKKFERRGYTGNHAVLDMLMVDFMETEDIPASAHKKYLAYSYRATVTVDSVTYTDGKLSVKFSQASDPVFGTAHLEDETGEHPVFTPGKNIPVASVALSASELEVFAGEETGAEVSFSPLGCPYDFTVEVSPEGVCAAERVRDSVRISGLAEGTAVITVKSGAYPTITASIDVTVVE
jgi:hypothetical protein